MTTYDMQTQAIGIAQEQLTNELRAALGELITGVSTYGATGLIVHFVHKPTPQEAATMKAVVEAHVPQDAP